MRRVEFAKSGFSAWLIGYFLDVSLVTAVSLLLYPNFLVVSISILVFCMSPSGALSLSLPLSSFSGCLHHYPSFLCVQDRGVSFCLSVSIFLLIFCRSPSFSLFSVSLHLFPHFLPISTFSFIFCLSPSLSSFSGCLYLYPHFLYVSS